MNTTSLPELLHVIDCMPGKIITINLQCEFGRVVQTAMRCETDINGNGNGEIRVLDKDPCFIFKAGQSYFLAFTYMIGVFLSLSVGILCLYEYLSRRERKAAMAMDADAEAYSRWKFPSRSDMGLVEGGDMEEEEEGEDEEMGTHRVAAEKRAVLTPSESERAFGQFDESDAESSAGSSGSESWWTPSRCGIELKRGMRDH